MKFLDVMWFSGRNSVGIVRTEDEYNGIVYYIGGANAGSEQLDIEYIMAFGAKFPKHVGDILFGIDV
jgi:hypothetical protein